MLIQEFDHLTVVICVLLYCDVIDWLSAGVYMESTEGQAAGHICEGFSAVSYLKCKDLP